MGISSAGLVDESASGGDVHAHQTCNAEGGFPSSVGSCAEQELAGQGQRSQEFVELFLENVALAVVEAALQKEVVNTLLSLATTAVGCGNTVDAVEILAQWRSGEPQAVED